jgi:murein L,D-transpeptidase YcbB/YkuD
MRHLFFKSSFSGLILAALAASTWSLPAVTPHQSSQSGAKKPAAKTSSSSPHSSSSSTKKTSAHSKSSHKKSKKVRGQEAPMPDRINQIQEALASKGAFTGEPTGKWDDSTVDAMKKFQASKGLNATGKLDALTLQKLGLGSETAGLAAPTPPPNSVNRLRNTSTLPDDPHDSN